MSDFITLYHLTNSSDRLTFLDPKYCHPCEGGQKEGIYFVNSLRYWAIFFYLADLC